MKKKFLLAVLPALLILSACQAGPKANVCEDVFPEDTLAHEEIFGDVALPQPGIRKVENPIVNPGDEPTIGVQSKVEDGKVSFRFIAAVNIDNANLVSTVAKWKRTVSKPDGTYPMDTAEYACEKVYTSLSSGGSEYTIGAYNTAHGTSYSHFVVYTLRNITISGREKYYVSAYLTLSEGTTSKTKAIVTSVDETIQRSYDPALGTSFITGEFDGTPDVKYPTFIRDDSEDANKAEFTGISLKKDDTFVINEFYETKLYIKNTAKFTGDNNHSGYYFADESGEMKANYDGSYNLFLTKSDQVYTTGSNVVTDGKLYVDVNVSWWDDASAWTSVYAYKGTLGVDSVGKWFALTGTFWGNTFRAPTEEDFFTSANYAIGYTHIVVCRLKNGTNLPADKTVWDTSIIHNQYSVSLLTNGYEDCAYLYNNVEISMGSR